MNHGGHDYGREELRPARAAADDAKQAQERECIAAFIADRDPGDETEFSPAAKRDLVPGLMSFERDRLAEAQAA